MKFNNFFLYFSFRPKHVIATVKFSSFYFSNWNYTLLVHASLVAYVGSNFDCCWCCCSIIIKISSKLSIYLRYWIANWVLMPWRRLISINTLNKKKMLCLVRQSSKEVEKKFPVINKISCPNSKEIECFESALSGHANLWMKKNPSGHVNSTCKSFRIRKRFKIGIIDWK